MREVENYETFLRRIRKFEKPELSLESCYFSTNASALLKVDQQNHFSEFYGDTVVFDLDVDAKKRVFQISDRLYTEVPECFAERLNESTMHMTLHDLSNAPALYDVEQEVVENESKLKRVIEANPILPQTIKMKTHYITDILHISLVLALCPVDEHEYEKLMQLYNLVDEVKELSYKHTPHITLAYYNRYGFSKESVSKLESIVNDLNKESFEIILSTDKLVYQRFKSMNDYTTIFNLLNC